MSLLRLNGRDVETLGFQLLGDVALDVDASQREDVQIPERVGVTPGRVGVGVERTITLSLALDASTTIAERQPLVDALLGWVRRPGLTEIELSTAPGRVFWGLYGGHNHKARWESVAFTHGSAVIDLQYTVPDGSSRSKTLRSLGLAAGVWTEVPGLGSRPCEPRIFIPRGGTDPTVEVAYPDRTVAHSLTLDGQPPFNGWWEVDTATRRIVQAAANGNRTDVTDTAYDEGLWPVFDPALGTETLPPLVRSSRLALAYYQPLWI